MNRNLVKRIADAVLYEGYMLYPYRPSVKNRQRWTFGGLYPEAYTRTQTGNDLSSNQTECLVHGSAATILDATVRFLHLTERVVGEFAPPLTEWPANVEPRFRAVESLRVGERIFHTWQEAEERHIELTSVALGEIGDGCRRKYFAFPARRWLEPLPGPGGQIEGALVRQQKPIEGIIEVEARRLDQPSCENAAGNELFKVSLRIANLTIPEATPNSNREDALLHSLISTHTILGVRQGEFVSLLDPPDRWGAAAEGCCNIGTWPVLVGEEGARDTVLSSPIILYDYPQVAPESPGDLFDGTEIDEILSLRILTLTDEEKRAAIDLDERGRALLMRTETLSSEQISALHGTVRK